MEGRGETRSREKSSEEGAREKWQVARNKRDGLEARIWGGETGWKLALR